MHGAVVNVDELTLERSAQLLIGLLGEPRLMLKLGHAFADLLVGEAFLAVAVFDFQIQQIEHLVVLDQEDFVSVGLARGEHHVGKPLDGLEGSAVRRDEALAALRHEQGSAGDGVERLDTAVDQHRQAAEAAQVDGGGILGRHQRASQVTEKNDEQGEREIFFHATTERLRMKPVRWSPNWIIKPSPIKMQAT